MAPRITIREIALSKRPVRFAHPFRFGAVTVAGADEVVVHAEIDVEGFGRSRGAAAELMVPKWFNKNPTLSPDQTVSELQASLDLAVGLYREPRAADTAFGLHAACYQPLMNACAARGIPPLASAFGAAEIDKAILDALLRATTLDVFTGLSRNVTGLDARLTPDIDAESVTRFLSSRTPQKSVFVRHTVGLLDSMESVAEATRSQGLRYYKIKLGGDPKADRERLIEITQTLDAITSDYRITLDANEQYPDERVLGTFVDALLHDDALESANQRIAYIEQPLPREKTLARPLGDIGKRFAFIIDEADDGYDAFRKAAALGYRGVSTKSCKGLYKSLLNGARAAWLTAQGFRAFVAAEDLTCQAGLAVQQDTALAAFHGIVHCERNGHHYGNGFAAVHPCEAEAFLAAHPDLYERAGGGIRLRVTNGAIEIGSLGQASGFASAVDPALINLQQPSGNKPIKELAS